MGISARRNSAGFTLVELVIVIVLVGIVAAMGAAFISKPVEGYMALTRRAELVDAAESALRLMQREIRRALPNSIRIKAEGSGNGTVLEIIPTIAAGRYRLHPGGGVGNPDCRLQFNSTDGSFASTSDLNNMGIAVGHQVVVSNWTSSGNQANAYVGDNRTGLLGIQLDDAGCSGEDRLQISFQFPFASDRQRFYVVGQPVAYLCDTTSQTLRRYANYGFQADQNDVDTDPELGGSGALVTRHLTSCTFQYDPGAPERGGLLTLDLTVTDPVSSEQVRLLHQVHVDNAP